MINILPYRKSDLHARDHIHTTAPNMPLQEKVDLRQWDSLVEDQGALGSCTSNAITNAYELMVKKQYPDKFVELSKLFVYYNSRLLDRTTKDDIGSTLRASLQAVRLFGVCAEKLWPYNIEMFDVRPPKEAYRDGINHRILTFKYLPRVIDALDILNSGKPIVIGIEVYSEFMFLNSKDDIVPFPTSYDVSGGHAMSVVGYDLTKRLFLAKNSFGTSWGDNGYCWIPFEYVDTQTFEMWCFDIAPQNTTVLTS